MMIDSLSEEDWDELILIHRKYYVQEFSLQDFFQRISGIVIRDPKDEDIIVAGGIRPILEVVAITNKDKSVRTRCEALHELFQVARYTTKQMGYNQIHAFVQDDMWLKHLKRVGFNPTKGQALYIEV